MIAFDNPAPDISEYDAEQRLSRDRGDVAALIAKADHRILASDHRAALSYYRTAIAVVERNRYDHRDADRARSIIAWLDERMKNHMLGSLEAAGFPEESRHPRFRKSLEIMLGERQRAPVYERFPQIPMLYFYPDLPHVQFVDTASFDWVVPLQEFYPVMREEALALLADHDSFTPYVRATSERPQSDVHGMLENPDWSTLFLWENGAPVTAHIERCPAIFKAVIEHVPLCHIGPRAPSVMLSLLRPGAKIPPHTGMLNPRFICHLPLIVPTDCGFRVGQETRQWQEGELMMFDDTVEHEAWNNSGYDRLVLIFDIWRPELSVAEQQQITALFAAVDSY